MILGRVVDKKVPFSYDIAPNFSLSIPLGHWTPGPWYRTQWKQAIELLKRRQPALLLLALTDWIYRMIIPMIKEQGDFAGIY